MKNFPTLIQWILRVVILTFGSVLYILLRSALGFDSTPDWALWRNIVAFGLLAFCLYGIYKPFSKNNGH